MLTAHFVVSLLLKIIFEFPESILPARTGCPEVGLIPLPHYDLADENSTTFTNWKKKFGKKLRRFDARCRNGWFYFKAIFKVVFSLVTCTIGSCMVSPF